MRAPLIEGMRIRRSELLDGHVATDSSQTADAAKPSTRGPTRLRTPARRGARDGRPCASLITRESTARMRTSTRGLRRRVLSQVEPRRSLQLSAADGR